MCGIAGCLLRNKGTETDAIRARLGRMAELLKHRGPDDSGVWVNSAVGLAHTRLSILDLSAAGHQPMLHPDGSVAVSFNGEIYNFQALRAELEGLGCGFSGHSDTEVLVHGYKAWGEDLFGRLQGMFAIALWDQNTHCLYLVRDRFGKKPLYFLHNDSHLIFGSEIKAILAWPEVERQPDYEAIHHYLSYQYVPGPWTAFKGIRKLMPGHVMRISLDEWHMDSKTFWQMPRLREATDYSFDADEAMESLRSHLLDAVRLRMVSDVPLGAFLSGGVDSSAVVAAMARISDRPVKTFSIGFDYDSYDETSYARMVSERYGTEHHERIVHPDAVGILPDIVRHYGEPFADPSAIPTFYVSQLAREHVTVALSGDGGDETFIGYSRYVSFAQAGSTNRPPLWMRRILGNMAKTPPPFFRSGKVSRLLRHLAATRADSRGELYAPYLVYFGEADKEDGYGDVMRPYLGSSSLQLVEKYLDEYRAPPLAASWADIHTYLPDDILTKVDVASMAFGLEVRAPFLDPMLAEWAAGLPLEWKFDGWETKRLLKKAMEPWLPDEILYRPKMGFGVPVDHWFRGELSEMLKDTLLSERFRERGLMKPEYVETMVREHQEGVRLHHTRLWGLLMLELWFRMWIDDLPMKQVNI